MNCSHQMNNMKRFSFHFEIRYISSRSSNGEKKIATHSLLSLSLSPILSMSDAIQQTFHFLWHSGQKKNGCSCWIFTVLKWSTLQAARNKKIWFTVAWNLCEVRPLHFTFGPGFFRLDFRGTYIVRESSEIEWVCGFECDRLRPSYILSRKTFFHRNYNRFNNGFWMKHTNGKWRGKNAKEEIIGSRVLTK